MTVSPAARNGRKERALGCLLGQLTGDALGAPAEFSDPETLRRRWPGGLRDLVPAEIHGTLAGQPTDDSEMALALARTLVARGGWDREAVRAAYREWLASDPFDVGVTVSRGLTGTPDPESQANGALMRVSPLGIAGAAVGPRLAAEWARQDAALTHPHPVCREANALFVAAIARAIRDDAGPGEVYAEFVRLADDFAVPGPLRETVRAAAAAPPADTVRYQGWVLIALGNALWQLLHAPSLEDALVDTVMRGGDTDTNAAICGALLGAVHGAAAIPERWTRVLLSCRPDPANPDARRPRPRSFWPVDAPDLAARLLALRPPPSAPDGSPPC